MKGENMAKPNLLRIALLLSVCLCGAAANTGVGSAQTPSQTPATGPAQTPCASTSDAQIVAAIQEKIKADKRFDGQWRHLNVSSRDRVVTLNGWVKGRVQIRVLVRFAAQTSCVKRVINRLSPYRTVGCGPGQKPCGDICIDRTQDCNMLQ
jgi:BON domain